MTRYALIQSDEKQFKIDSGGAGGASPYVSQYDGEEYNHIATIDTVANTRERRTSDYINEVVARGMELAAMHDSCDKEDYEFLDTDRRVTPRSVHQYF